MALMPAPSQPTVLVAVVWTCPWSTSNVHAPGAAVNACRRQAFNDNPGLPTALRSVEPKVTYPFPSVYG